MRARLGRVRIAGVAVALFLAYLVLAGLPASFVDPVPEYREDGYPVTVKPSGGCLVYHREVSERGGDEYLAYCTAVIPDGTARDVHRLWHGAVPETAGDAIGRPSLLLVRFPDTDQVLVVSVLYREITTLHGTDGPTLHTTPLFDIGLCYVAGVLTAAEAGALQAFGADDEPLFHNYVARGPVR